MDKALPQASGVETSPKQRPLRPWARVARYAGFRALMLFLLLTGGLYLTFIVVNLGGYIDEINRALIEDDIMYMAKEMKGVPPEQRTAVLEQRRAELTEDAGLNQPFLLRCLRWLYDGMTMKMLTPNMQEALPKTLLLVGSSYLLLFFTATFMALYLSRHYGTLIDRLVTALSPLSAAPSWVHGIILVAIFAAQLHILPFGGMYDPYPPAHRWGYIFVVLKHMVLPVTAILLGLFFQCVYAWRTIFLIHSSEDYVELAKAKGLPDRMLERRYVLRPALPYFITSFALLLVSFWQETIALEYFFNWPGIGKLYFDSVRAASTYRILPTMVIVVLFAYLLAATVFSLDVVYALLDPRVRLSGSDLSRRPARSARQRFRPARQPAPGARRDVAVVPAARASIPRVRPWKEIGRGLRSLGKMLFELTRYPSSVVGLALILALVGISIYAVIALPYVRAVYLWNWEEWKQNPQLAQPAWTNWFRREQLPETIVMSSQGHPSSKETRALTPEMTAITITLPFDYPYRALPQDMRIDLTARYQKKLPLAYMDLFKPDGSKIPLGSMQLTSAQFYLLSGDERLGPGLAAKSRIPDYFAAPGVEPPESARGRYELRVRAFVFEAGSDVDAQFAVYGLVHGLAGTDDRRRDLSVALLWGAPVALVVGLLGAVGSTLISISVAAVAAWFGGWVDRVIQWFSELSMLQPLLPLAIMSYFIFSKKIWVILAILVVVSSFGRALKTFRAALMQVREQPYVEAAQSYGAGNARIIVRYLAPRVIPVLVPQLVMMIPGLVFLEATLALLGVSDFYLPTWGKVICDALTRGGFQIHYYWALEPIALLLLTGVAFSMVGYSLDRIFNPRLRSMRAGRE